MLKLILTTLKCWLLLVRKHLKKKRMLLYVVWSLATSVFGSLVVGNGPPSFPWVVQNEAGFSPHPLAAGLCRPFLHLTLLPFSFLPLSGCS